MDPNSQRFPKIGLFVRFGESDLSSCKYSLQKFITYVEYGIADPGKVFQNRNSDPVYFFFFFKKKFVIPCKFYKIIFFFKVNIGTVMLLT